MAPRAETVVQVIADTSQLEEQIVTSTRRAVRDAGREFDEGLRNATGQAGREAGQRMGTNMATAANQRMRRGLRAGIGGGGGGVFRRAGRAAGGAFGRGFSNATRRRIRFSGDVLKWLGIGTATLAALPTAVTGLSSLAAALTAAAGAAVAFSSAIAPAAGVLTGWPAAVAAVVAATGTLRLAFLGIEDAAEEALTGTAEDFREAIEDLAPAAQQAMRELRGMRGVFTDLRDAVQGAFFAPLVGQLEDLSGVISGPLQSGMADLAGEFGRIGRTLLDFAETDQAAAAIRAVFDALSDATRAASSGLEPALRGIAAAVTALAPQMRQFGQVVGDFLENWGRNLQLAAETGLLERSFENALRTLSQMWDVAKNLLSTAYAIGSAIEDAFGGDLLQSLQDATRDLRNWSLRPDVQLGITHMFIDLRTAVQNLEPAFRALGNGVRTLVDAIAAATRSGGAGLGGIIEGLADGLAALARGAGEFIGAAGPELGDLLRELGRALGDLLAGAGPGAARGFESLANALQDIDWNRVGKDLGHFFSTLAQIVEDLGPVLDKLLDLIGTVAEILDRMTGLREEQGPQVDTGIGTIGIGDAMLELHKKLNQAGTQFQLWIGQFASGIMDGIRGIGAGFQISGELLGQFFSGFGQAILNAPRRLWNFLQPALAVVGAFFGGFGQGLLNAPRRLWNFLQPALAVVGAFFGGFGQGLLNAPRRLWNFLQPALAVVGALFRSFGRGIWNQLTGLWSWLQLGISRAGQFFRGFGRGIWNQLSGLATWLQLGVIRAGRFFQGMGRGILDAVQSLWDWLQPILDSVGGFFDEIGSSISNFADRLRRLSDIVGGIGLPDWLPGAANGGIVNRATPLVAGEAGPEVIIPLRRPDRAAALAQRSGLSDVLAARGAGSSAGGLGSRPNPAPTGHGTTSVHAPITVHAAAADPELVAARVGRRLQRTLATAGAVS